MKWLFLLVLCYRIVTMNACAMHPIWVDLSKVIDQPTHTFSETFLVLKAWKVDKSIWFITGCQVMWDSEMSTARKEDSSIQVELSWFNNIFNPPSLPLALFYQVAFISNSVTMGWLQEKGGIVWVESYHSPLSQLQILFRISFKSTSSLTGSLQLRWVT